MALRSRLLATLAGLTTISLLVTRRAEAADAEIPLALDYDAAAGCANVDTFIEQVKHRAPEIRRAATDETAERVQVVLEALAPSPTRYRGTLTYPDADASSTRTFHGARCEDVANAVAVALALHAVETPPPHRERRRPRQSRSPPNQWKRPRRTPLARRFPCIMQPSTRRCSPR